MLQMTIFACQERQDLAGMVMTHWIQSQSDHTGCRTVHALPKACVYYQYLPYACGSILKCSLTERQRPFEHNASLPDTNDVATLLEGVGILFLFRERSCTAEKERASSC